MRQTILIVFFLFALACAASAVPAYPKPIIVSQPDGTALTVKLHGDEYLHWTTCGNSLVAQGSDGYWHFATFDAEGNLQALGSRVKAGLSGDGLNVVPPSSAVAKAREQRKAMNPVRSKSGARMSPISEGKKRFLILLLEFSDKSFTRTKSDFNDLLNSTDYTYNGATGSVNRYYQDVSFGKFNPQYDVFGPIKVPYTSAQCANDALPAVKYACKFADDSLGVNFANYCNESSSRVDNVFFFFPGYNQAEGGGSGTIWPHAATYGSPFLTLDGKSLYNYGCTSEFQGNSGAVMAGIGTFAHEFGHVIGLPDFYDTDYEESGGEGFGLYTLSLMSSGNYNNEGRTPPYLTYEEKNILGWDAGLTLLTAGVNTLSKTSENKTYYNPTTTEGEYYLYESRPNIGWDTYTDCPGLAIYHVDKSDYVMPNGYTAEEMWLYTNAINAYCDHQCMDLVETKYPESSVQYIDQMTWPGWSKVTSFTSQTSPAAKSWSGKETGYNITNISFNGTTGVTTFNVTKDLLLAGTVRNTSGDALGGVEITVNFVSSAPSVAKVSYAGGDMLSAINFASSPNAAQYRVVTGSDGRFEFAVTEAGNYSISAKKNGYVSFFGNVTVDAVTELPIVLLNPVDQAGVVLQKYTGSPSGLVGYGANSDHYAGLRYTAAELTEYVGDRIKSISFMAYTNSGGTVDKMGVQVYFDSELQCDCESEQVFSNICTVNLEEFDLKIPSGKSVTFAFYLINSSYGWPLVYTDDSPVDGANLISQTGKSWSTVTYGNFVISASVIHNAAVVDLSGINYIPHASSYTAGDSFKLELKKSSVNPPSSVSWTVNGEAASGTVVLSKGVFVIRAYLTYPSGRKETIEIRLNVK